MIPKKTALVTGGSRGIGRAAVLSLAQKGYNIIIVYKSNEKQAQKTADEVQLSGQQVLVLKYNVADTASLDSFISQLRTGLDEKFKTDKIDYLVNNAGIGLPIPSIEETAEEDFDKLMNLHLKGTFFLTQRLIPILNDNGSIVNITTALTRFTIQGSAAYAMMKSALETFTRYLAAELGSRGIRVNSVAPGAVATDFSEGRLKNSPEAQQWVKNISALKHIAVAEDISGIISFLCSDDSRWVTAERIEASGGAFL